MKKRNYLLLAVLSVFILSACEKVVVLNVNSGDPVVIINSQLTNKLDYWLVDLTLTQPYFDQSDITTVDDAEVVITDSDGQSDTLIHDQSGFYFSKDKKVCEIGKTYTLTVKHRGETYTASETCFYQDTISFIKSYYLPERNGFIPKGYYVFEKASEYEPDGDFYRWRITKNGIDMVDTVGYLLDDDEFRSSGFFNINIDSADPLKDIDRGIYPRPFPLNFDKNDTVQIDQIRITEAYYNFLSGFATQQQRSGTPFDPPPSNPRSNIMGGAYGYFSVVNISSKEIVVKD